MQYAAFEVNVINDIIEFTKHVRNKTLLHIHILYLSEDRH